MIHSISPDIEQAVHLFFADHFLDEQGAKFYRVGMEEIKKEFRKKALLFHPDRAILLGKSRGLLEKKFKEITDAYGILKAALADDYLIVRSPFVPKPNMGYHRAETVSRPSPPKAAPHSGKASPASAGTRPKDTSASPRPFQRQHRQSFFFKGTLPRRKLRLGEYLFYKRVITWHTLIQAIVWQHRVRPRLGQIALDLNYMDPQDVYAILKNRRFREPFGRAAVRLGFLDDYRRFVLLGRQRSFNLPLGKFFIDARILDKAAIDQHILENRLHNFYCNRELRRL
ncbi:MAG: J domain-containing protein [Desulfobacterales bacterium]|jgi:hypothetical protein|nr:J domain-containing protein [Desulfobacterales bacterium]